MSAIVGETGCYNAAGGVATEQVAAGIEKEIMYPKFIITTDGVLRLGRVYLHKHLLYADDLGCNGGGFWEVDTARSIIILHGRSADFGGPDFGSGVRRVEWGKELMPMPVFYAPNYPNLDPLEIVWVG